MGRNNRGRTQRRHFKENRENVWKRSKSEPSQNSDAPHRSWEPFATENPTFDEYYKEQGIVSSSEWDSFVSLLRTPLPAAFRINSSGQFYTDIRSQLEDDFMISLQAEANDGSEVEAIRPLPWYPHNLAWHSNFSRMQLRKNQSLERFHQFLKLENEIGNITRQEAVSMVPPLFLDVSPDHFVLDMCAAPGSKTFQLLEIVYNSCKPGTLPGGLIVANDVDVQRCNLLIHQTKRMCTANLVVTNHEAQHFPGCRLKNQSDDSGTGVTQLLFDRVLCDVPCSGDGTLRKAPDIWRKWNAGMGNGVHNLQVQIAMRGLSLLKVDGKMVYSTCSMNPVENEAVVAEILRKCGGSVELVDVSNELPQLIRRPGLKKWKVRDKGAWLTSFKSVLKYRRNLIVPSMFPSGRSNVEATDDSSNSANLQEQHGDNGGNDDCIDTGETSTNEADELVEEVSEFPLERCMRIVPHDQNTGAFFIAVLCKRSPLPPVCQEKFKIQREKISSSDIGDDVPKSEPVQNFPDEITEDTNGFVGGGTEDKLSEVDLIDNKANEVDLEVDLDEITENTNGSVGGETVDKLLEVDLVDNEPNEANMEEPSNKKSNSCKAGGKRKLQIQGKWKGVDPVLFFKDDAIIESIKMFYGIGDSFPLAGHLVSRNPDNNHVKRIYYVSESVKDVLQLNFSVGQQLKIASVGLKMFERQTSREGNATKCAFRISSEGLPVILPHITKQIVYASLPDFKHLLEYKSIKYADFVDADLALKAEALMQGCCVVVLKNDDNEEASDISSIIAIGCWKGKSSVSVMVTALDCQELLERLVNRQTK